MDIKDIWKLAGECQVTGLAEQISQYCTEDYETAYAKLIHSLPSTYRAMFDYAYGCKKHNDASENMYRILEEIGYSRKAKHIIMAIRKFAKAAHEQNVEEFEFYNEVLNLIP